MGDAEPGAIVEEASNVVDLGLRAGRRRDPVPGPEAPGPEAHGPAAARPDAPGRSPLDALNAQIAAVAGSCELISAEAARLSDSILADVDAHRAFMAELRRERATALAQVEEARAGLRADLRRGRALLAAGAFLAGLLGGAVASLLF